MRIDQTELTLYGYRLVRNPALVVYGEDTVAMTWRERLLSWPWRPWRATKRVTVPCPDPRLYFCNPGGGLGGDPAYYVGHPETIRRILRAADEGELNQAGLDYLTRIAADSTRGKIH